jgi:hypothetical protein
VSSEQCGGGHHQDDANKMKDEKERTRKKDEVIA